MTKKSVALLTIHGMGDTEENYHQLFLERIEKQMGKSWEQVEFNSIYYQDILQFNQNKIFEDMKQLTRWDKLREFVLYNLSDAASLDYQKEKKNSLYHQTQIRIATTLQNIYKQHGNIPVVIVAYSLGCHVLSNYIWDAQQVKPDGGIWKWKTFTKLSRNEDYFIRLKKLNNLITIGCNIPVFVAGYKDIKPFQKLNKNFEWLNIYDQDDVLGWPLAPLSDSYKQLVTDLPINANEGFSDLFLKSWNPLSHEHYFGDKVVIKAVGNALKKYTN